MAASRSLLALIFLCVAVCLSGLGDCRIVLGKEEAVAEQEKVGEKEQSVHLFLPSEKDESDGIARETQPWERPDLRGRDGFFHGERSKRFRFERPGGCHHGRFKPWGHRMKEHMRFPFEFPGGRARFTDFHRRAEEFWHLRKESGFDCAFPKGHWHERGHEYEYWPEHEHGYGKEKNQERQPDVKEKWVKTA